VADDRTQPAWMLLRHEAARCGSNQARAFLQDSAEKSITSHLLEQNINFC
jgi:hypothetical protein